MRIVLFGLTGFTGGNVAREAALRGHEVLGVARHSAVGELPDLVTATVGDIHDPADVARLARDADAIVVAVPGRSESGPLLAALPSLLDAAAASGARLGIVGGASSLRWEEGGPRLLDAGFPPEWKPEAHALNDVLEALRASATPVDWFYLSPAEIYGAVTPGQRTGAYRLGTELVVADDRGRSRIGGEDFAIALVDELERPAHHRMRFTVGY
jgi:putative NADH-flavin reductase